MHHAVKSGIMGFVAPVVIKGGSHVAGCWASLLRCISPQDHQRFSMSSPWRSTMSLRDLQMSESRKDLVLDISNLGEIGPALICLGHLDLPVVLMAKIDHVEESTDDPMSFVVKATSLAVRPVSYISGSMDLYLEKAADQLEAEPDLGLNSLFEIGDKVIYQLSRLMDSCNAGVAGNQRIAWVDFLWLFVLVIPILTGVAWSGTSVLQGSEGPCRWFSKIDIGSAWGACLWMSIAPVVLESFISTSLVFACDGKIANLMVKIYEQVGNSHTDLVDQRIYDAVSPGSRNCPRAQVGRLSARPGQMPINLSIKILSMFLKHAVEIEKHLPDGGRSARLADLGFPSSQEVTNDINAYGTSQHVEWGSPLMLARLRSGRAEAIGALQHVGMKQGSAVVPSGPSAPIPSSTSPAMYGCGVPNLP